MLRSVICGAQRANRPVQREQFCRPRPARLPPVGRASAAGMPIPQQSLSVAVVGAGAAGLVAARELLREGHSVTVYEQAEQLGGVWRYTDEVEDDPLGQAPGRRQVHGSMYAGLRTNLPREVMGFVDFPFDYSFPGSKDPDQFCSHQEVQSYLEAFACRFDLLRYVRFATEVQHIAPLPPPAATAGASGNSQARWWRWQLTARRSSHAAASTSSSSAEPFSGTSSSTSVSGAAGEEYDAVVVCNGHYSRPRVPSFPGQDVFPGAQVHSHNYRRPEEFRGQTLVLVGAAFSGTDIAQELLGAGAKKVLLSARAWEDPATGDAPDEGTLAGEGSGGAAAERLAKVPNISTLNKDGSVTFESGATAPGVDTVMYCTGYLYSFPFLEGTPAAPGVEDNRVHPVYGHAFPPRFAPTLSFVGLPWKVVPFPQFELQAKWIARCLSGRVRLPSKSEMEQAVGEHYRWMEDEGLPARYTHRQQGELQRRYNEWLVKACGPDVQPLPEWRSVLYAACGASRKAHGLHFRDAPMVGAEAALEAARQEAEEVRGRNRQAFVA